MIRISRKRGVMTKLIVVPVTAYLGALLAIYSVDAVGQRSEPDMLREEVARTKARFPALTTAEAIAMADGEPVGRLGVTNMKAVLPGLVYRSGSMPIRVDPKGQRQDTMPGLAALACAGFGRVIYHYGPVSGENPVKCPTTSAKLIGTRSRPTIDDRALAEALTAIHGAIRGNSHRPILLQCNNGKHASAYTAAIALRQFCGLSGRAAVRYWNRDAGSDNELAAGKAADLRHRITTFPDRGDLKEKSKVLAISKAEQVAVCPEVELTQLEASASRQ